LWSAKDVVPVDISSLELPTKARSLREGTINYKDAL
jgi:hypothetical protein